MRRRAAGTAGRGRRQNLPRTLRAARSCRPPPAAGSVCPAILSGHSDRPFLATSASHSV